MAARLTLYTVGHGAAALDDFIAMLQSASIHAIVDVRRYPGSRRHPHFNSDALAESLKAAGIAYRNAIDLGGRRKLQGETHNPGLRHEAFRAYADYMETPPFREAFTTLMQQSAEEPTAVMCSETLWWNCHRRLIADAAVLLGERDVMHILGGALKPHVLTEGVRRMDERLYYGVGSLGV